MSKRNAKPKSKEPSSLRPVPARLLKSVGDTLRPQLGDARVLDLYAGTGRFGLLALEEGAARVDFVEADSQLARLLRDHVQRFGDKAKIHTSKVDRFWESNSSIYDIIFADPPFEGLTEEDVQALAERAKTALKPEGIFLVKHPSRMLTSPRFLGFRYWKQSSVGDAGLTYLVRET